MEVVRRDPDKAAVEREKPELAPTSEREQARPKVKKPARSGQGERNVSLDVLRIAAVMGIIAVHAIDGLETIHPLRDWVTRNVYYSMVRWSVPAFIMISGALFLDHNRPLSTRRLFRHNVLRLVVAYCVWTTAYMPLLMADNRDHLNIVLLFIKGPFHLWFLYMIVGLYVIVPLLRQITANRRKEEYFLCLAFLTASAVPYLLRVISLLDETTGDVLQYSYSQLGISLPVGFTGYFVLGHYLTAYSTDRRKKRLVYWLGASSTVLIAVATIGLSLKMGRFVFMLYEWLTPFAFLQSAAVFLYFTSRDWTCLKKHEDRLKKVSKLTFGIYLVHIMVMELIGRSTTLPFPIIVIPAYCLVVFALSFAAVTLLDRIPVVRKYAL